MDYRAFLLNFIEEIFNIPPVVVLCYLPFYKKLTKPIRTIAVQLIAIYTLFSIPGLILLTLGFSGAADATATSFVIVSFFYFKKTVRDSHQKRNFIFCIGIYAGGTAHGISHIFNMVDIWRHIEGLVLTQIISIGISVIVYLIIGIILHRVISVRMSRVRPQDMDWLWVIPFMFSVLTYFYVVGHSFAGLVDYVFPVVFTMLTAISFIVFYMVIRMLERAGINAQLELEIATANEQRRSLTAEKAALENLTQVKTGFLQDIKHEIRNPLHVISLGMGYITQYFEPKGDTMEAENILATVQNEALRLGRMINGMVELATTEGSKTNRQKVDFTALIKACGESYKLKLANNQNSLQIKTPDTLLYVYGESEQLERVLINILSNANDSVKCGEISIEVSSDNGYNIVSISDNGSGIDSQLMPRIFQRGVSGKGCDGYGLAISKTIVEAHGGIITIESGELQITNGSIDAVAAAIPINGTVVTFTIPAYGGQGGHGG